MRSTTNSGKPGRMVRLAAWGAGIALVILAVASLLPWLAPKIPMGLARRAAIAFLKGYLALYLVALPTAAPAGLILVRSLLRARQLRQRRPVQARLLAACVSVVLGSIVMEGLAGIWLSRSDRTPDPQVRLNPGAAPAPTSDRDLYLVVIGESSALGMPFNPSISIAQIVAWQMERIFPGRRVFVDTRAVGGYSLDDAIHTLEKPWRKPDAVLLYSGHNEFHARYELMREVPFYADEFTIKEAAEGLLERVSPLARLILKTLDKLVVDRPPVLSSGRILVDKPAVTIEERAHRLAVYESGLKAFYRYCERVGALPILFVPSSNDGGFEPNRSVLRPSTPLAERQAFARAFAEARAIEAVEPSRSLRRYRELLADQPDFAEAHFRLARLLERSGQLSEARLHYILARDLDGYPLRLPGAFRDTARTEGGRHDGIVIDAEEVLGRLEPGGILDDRLFLDAMHPNLASYAELARETLRRLHQRRAFGWPENPAPGSFTQADVVSSFGFDASRWVGVCQFVAAWYDSVAPIRFDPSQRIARKERYEAASRAIARGAAPERVNCPGIGVDSSDH